MGVIFGIFGVIIWMFGMFFRMIGLRDIHGNWHIPFVK